jgi:hypothetical protein
MRQIYLQHHEQESFALLQTAMVCIAITSLLINVYLRGIINSLVKYKRRVRWTMLEKCSFDQVLPISVLHNFWQHFCDIKSIVFDVTLSLGFGLCLQGRILLMVRRLGWVGSFLEGRTVPNVCHLLVPTSESIEFCFVFFKGISLNTGDRFRDSSGFW